MKQFFSGIILLAVFLGVSNYGWAQVPSVTVGPIPSTCSGTNTTLHYSATNSPTSYQISWYGSPAGIPNVPPGTFLPPITIPITVLSSAAAGTYYGDLVVSNASGASSPVVISVTVYALPIIYSMTGGGSYCLGGSGVHVGLSGSETGVHYDLYRGTGVVGTSWGSGGALDFGTETVAGSYTVIGTNVYTGCVSNMTGASTVSINPVPSVVSVTGGGGYCSGGTGVPVGLSGSVFGTYYQLYRGGTPIGTPQPGIGMSLDFGPQTIAGTYTVVAIDSAGPCTANMTGSATVNIYPTPTVYSLTGGGSYCDGGYGVNVGLSGSNTGVSYKLYLGSTLMATMAGTGAPINFGLETADGVYTAKAVNTVFSCSADMADSAVVSLIPKVIPSVSITPSIGSTICATQTDSFSAITVNGGPAPAYTWEVNGVFAGYGSSYVYTPSNGDVVKVTLTSNATCATPSVVSSLLSMTVKNRIVPTVVVNAYPGTTIINGTTETLTSVLINPGVAPVYQWLVNGAVVAGATASTFTSNAFVNGDSVTSRVYGCSDTPGTASVVIHVLPRVGVEQVSENGSMIQVIPNPNSGTFTISGNLVNSRGNQDVTIKITDVLGKVVYSGHFAGNNGKINEKITLPDTIGAGMYLINFQTGSENMVSRMVIE